MKRWWNGELKKMRKELNKLKAESYKYCALENHLSHQNLQRKSRKYREAIIWSKQEHWINYLKDMTAADIWTANKFIKEPAGESSNPRIPTLKLKDDRGIERHINKTTTKQKSMQKCSSPQHQQTK